MLAFYSIFLWNRPPLLFDLSYQNSDKILNIDKPLEWEEMTQELMARFLKLIIEWIKKHLAQLQSIK